MAEGRYVSYKHQLTLQIESGTRKNLNKAGAALMKAVKKELSKRGQTKTERTSKSGKTVRRYGKLHSEPSLPGEPPRKQTGRLLRSVKKRSLKRRIGVQVIAQDPKAHLLEFGTKRMAQRPFLFTTLNRMKPQLFALITQAIPMRATAARRQQ